MIKSSPSETVEAAIKDVLSQLLIGEHLTTVSIHGVAGKTFSSDFRYGTFELKQDAEHGKQKIRFKISVEEYACGVIAGSEVSIDDQGTTLADVLDEDSGLIAGQMFSVDAETPWYKYTKTEAPAEEGDAPAVGQLFTAVASVTDHGIAMAIYEETAVIDGNNFAWFVIQRPVNPDGSPYVDDRCPVVCLYSSVPTDKESELAYFCVVSEFDVGVPTEFLDASKNHPERIAVLNTMEQVAIAPSRRACIFFPSGFNTQRYFYDLELDMVAYTSADVISMSSIVPDDRFGSTKDYLALNANKKFNQGMRILLLDGES